MAIRAVSTPRRPALDDLDKAIIKALQLDGRRPYAQIGRELRVPEATVRQRAERLIARGIVQVVGVTDPLAMGFQHVESGALVRSSYHADEQVPSGRKSVLAGEHLVSQL